MFSCINDVDAKVEQFFTIFFLTGNKRTDIQFELIQYGFVYDTVAVDQVTEESIFFDGFQVLFQIPPYCVFR